MWPKATLVFGMTGRRHPYTDNLAETSTSAPSTAYPGYLSAGRCHSRCVDKCSTQMTQSHINVIRIPVINMVSDLIRWPMGHYIIWIRHVGQVHNMSVIRIFTKNSVFCVFQQTLCAPSTISNYWRDDCRVHGEPGVILHSRHIERQLFPSVFKLSSLFSGVKLFGTTARCIVSEFGHPY